MCLQFHAANSSVIILFLLLKNMYSNTVTLDIPWGLGTQINDRLLRHM